MSDDELVTVYTTAYQDELAMAKLTLQQAGVHFLADGEAVATSIHMGYLAQTRFMVKGRDAARALTALQAAGLITPARPTPLLTPKLMAILIIAALVLLALLAAMAANI